ELAGRVGVWSRRFMEHGLQRAPETWSDAALALAMLMRPNPWRLAPDRNGRLSAMLLEKDRYGKMRKYAVRPFGGYETLVAALAAKDSSNAAVLGRSAMLDAAAFGGDAHPNLLLTRFGDATLERTEPLPAPVIVANRKADAPAAEGG